MAQPVIRRAAAEFLAIFLAITLGLIADDWRQRRQDTTDGREAMRLVHDDLLADSVELAAVRGPLESHVRWTAWIQSNWDRASINEDSLGLAFRAYLFQNNPELRAAGYASLRASNGLGLIQPGELRTKIIAYYDRRQAGILQALGQHDLHRNSFINEVIARHALHPPGRTQGTVWPVVADPSRLTSSWQEIRADNSVYNQSMPVGAYADLALSLIDNAQEANAELRANILGNIEGARRSER